MSSHFAAPGNGYPSPSDHYGAAAKLEPYGSIETAMRHGHVEAAGPRHQIRAWKVLHASNRYESIRSLVELQAVCGMCPSVVTPEGLVVSASAAAEAARRSGSLRQLWSAVRNWRRVLLDNVRTTNCEIVHLHCLAAGIAGVRNFPAIVFELERFIEDRLTGNGAETTPEASAWIARSFRVAEQFVIARSAAIVVRSESMREQLLRRGASAEHVFVIPAALPANSTDAIPDQHRISGTPQGFAVFSSINIGKGTQSWFRNLVQAAKCAHQQVGRLALYVEADETCRRDAIASLGQLEADFELKFVNKSEAREMLAECSLVIAGAAEQIGVTPTENPLALTALLTGKPLLAADLACNRDVTPNGGGCLWFRPDNTADLARRIVFLASNPSFRASLASSGERYVHSARDPLPIAEQYDAVYRHALSRKRSRKLQNSAVSWQPLHACI